MEHYFKTNANTFLDERQGYITAHFRKDNIGHISLIQRISSEKETVKASVSIEAWTAIEKLLRMLEQQSYQECKYLYIQGALDCIELSQHLKSEYINSDYIE